MSLESFIGKKYKLETSDKFDEYLQAVGVNAMIRKFANSAQPVVELTKSGDEWCLNSVTSFKSSSFKFRVGVEFEHSTPDGRKCKSIVKIDGLTIHEVQTDGNGKETIIERIFSEDGILTMILKIDNIVCTRVYKLQ